MRGALEVGLAFLRLGCVSFGGPVAHLGYLRTEFVERRKWLDDAHYGDLVALCQFLPGPGSSQVVFAVGMQRAGLPGALAASLGFTLPSALLMIAFAYGVAEASDLGQAGWLHGLKLAAVAVVAQAVSAMGRKLCPDRARVTLAALAAAVLLTVPGALVQLGVIALGGLAGYVLYGGAIPESEREETGARGHGAALSALGTFFVLLVGLPILVAAFGSRELLIADSFYRASSLVFGGGHVVLPLLRAEFVPRGFLTDDQFLAGYGAAQAIPGPLFSFAGYLGTTMATGAHAWLTGLLALLSIFLPSWLLVGGALPFWHRLRSRAWAQAVLFGANAAVVGVLSAALYTPIFTEGVRGPRDLAAALVAFVLLEHWRAPPWLIVALTAAAGQWLL